MWKHIVALLLLWLVTPLVDRNPLLGQSGVSPSNYPNIRITLPGQAENAFITVPNITSPGDQPGRLSAISEFYWGNDYGVPNYMAGFGSTDHGLTWQGSEHLLPYSGPRAKSPSLVRVEWPPYELDLVAGFADGVAQFMYSGDFGRVWGDGVGYPWELPQDISLIGTDPPSSTIGAAYTTFDGAVLFGRSTSLGWVGWDTTVIISDWVPGYGMPQGVSVIHSGMPYDELFACWALFDAANVLEKELRFSRSTNSGLSWSASASIFTPTFRGVFGSHKEYPNWIEFRSTPSAGVDPLRSTIYLSWTNEIPPADPGEGGGIEPEPEDRFRPTEVRFTKSTDGGQTWNGEWGIVHPSSRKADRWSPKLHVDNGGGVNVLFYDSRRDTTDNKETQVYLARSTDQGSTWKNYLISDSWFVPKQVGSSVSAGGSALGVSSSDDYLYLTWNDSRTNIQQPYFARFPLRTTLIEDQPLLGWQMLSVPTIRDDMTRSEVFPGAAAVQKFENGVYVNIGSDELLSCTRGYWVKYNSTPPMIRHAGAVSDLMGMYVQTTHGGTSWNIIGSLSMPVSTTDVIQEPPGLVLSQYFRYDNGYVPTTVLLPGEGHYVKTSTNGRLLLEGVFSGDPPLEGTDSPSDVIVVRDAKGGCQILYVRAQGESAEMPPDPPEGMFNVRFANGNISQGLTPSPSVVPIPIHLKSVAYPVTVTWQLAPETAVRYWLRSGTRRDPLPRTGSISINRRTDDLIRLEASFAGLARASDVGAPKASVLHGAYPNPFNPSTEMRFEIAEASLVSIVVIDLLGRKVADLVAGEYEAGYYSVTWNPTGVASGVYLARFTAASTAGGVPYTQTHKLVLMK